jgi:transcriptional regulator with XRE-family HTH domain
MAGGRILRLIRQRQGINQFDLQLEGVITQANYSKIERGEVIPVRAKLDAILDALNANFNERQEVLISFGYLPAYDLPGAQEIAAACERCRPVLERVPMPAYLMDFVTRFLDWNDSFARLLGVYEGSDVLEGMRNRPLFKTQFDSRVRLSAFIEKVEPVLLADMQSIRTQLTPYREEQWYAEFVAELCQDPKFDHYWRKTSNNSLQEDVITEFAARVLQPVRFNLLGLDAQLHFYANHDALVGDDRFRIVYLIPADGFTIRQIERWLADDRAM